MSAVCEDKDGPGHKGDDVSAAELRLVDRRGIGRASSITFQSRVVAIALQWTSILVYPSYTLQLARRPHLISTCAIMATIPHELMQHNLPLLFVAGLEVPPRRASSSSTATTARRDSVGEGSSRSRANSTTSPALASPFHTGSEPETAAIDLDPFRSLQHSLYRVFRRRSGRSRLWPPSDAASQEIFKIGLVPRDYALPPRKVPASGHSPLSPLTPGSPVHPDGLLSPAWCRKWTEVVPAVFVLFERLSEGEEDERAKDELLVREIASRRQACAEWGIKLTVVLMASREALESPSLDSRLSFIRRTSALDSRASLFVLTPVDPVELEEFASSLEQALIGPALDVYAAHYKRNRRKRASRQGLGWAVRGDYKAAFFTELRGELELSRRHLEDCWQSLSQMFESPALLTPRSKRWQEARMLADSVAMRVCRLNLLDGNSPGGLLVFHQHLARFNPGPEERSRQYRLLAELVEAAGRDLRWELPLPQYDLSQDALKLVSLQSPSMTLQHPGFYYYAAAMSSSESTTLDASVTIDLLSKAYAHFKPIAPRMAVYVAYRIAQTYAQTEQWSMGAKFFERMSRSFKRERWVPILDEVQTLWLECAQRSGDVETAVRLLLESGASSDLEDQLDGLLSTTTPSSETLQVETSLFSASAAVWQETAHVGETLAWHVDIKATTELSFDDLRVVFVNGSAQEHGETRLRPGPAHELSGQLELSQPGIAQVDRVELVKKRGSWDIRLSVPISRMSRNSIWRDKPRSAKISERPHRISIVSTSQTIFLGEDFSGPLQLVSEEAESLDFKVSVKTDKEAPNVRITLDEQEGVLSSRSTHEVKLGLASDEPQTVTLIIFATTTTGDSSPQTHEERIQVDFVSPARISHDVIYRHPHGRTEAFVITKLDINPGVIVSEAHLEADHHKLIKTTLTPTLRAGNTHAILSRFEVALPEPGPPTGLLRPAGHLRLRWKRDGVDDDDGEVHLLSSALPALQPPLPRIHATSHYSREATAGQPFPYQLTVRNTTSRPVDGLTLHVEPSDGIVWSGPRETSLETIGPLAAKTMEWQLTKLADTPALPRLRIYHGLGLEAVEIDIL